MTYVRFTDKQKHGHWRPSFQFAKILTCPKTQFYCDSVVGVFLLDPVYVQLVVM